MFRAFLFLPITLLGVDISQYVFLVWCTVFAAFLSHCNVKLPWGPLNRVLITPDNHYWHHAKDLPKPYGVNFASNLMLWDHLFGTFHLPDHEPALGHDELPSDPDDVPGLGLAEGVDLLIHDAMFTPEEYPRFVGWGHSSHRQAFPFAEAIRLQNLYAVAFFRRHLLGEEDYDWFLSKAGARREDAVTLWRRN